MSTEEPATGPESPESLISATTCGELQELEFLHKTLDQRITVKKAASVISEPVPCVQPNSGFIPLLDKVADAASSLEGQQGSASDVLSGREGEPRRKSPDHGPPPSQTGTQLSHG